jgi:hypothetical protein
MSKAFYTRIAGFCVMLVVVSFRGRAWAQEINSWTNPSSAPWEAMYWSLGVLPDSTQSVMITNAGYKAVGISPLTRANYTNSMTVSNLTVSAPTNAFNTLLLNYFGTGTPLDVLNGCTIGTNGVIENLHAGFEVQSGSWTVNGGQYIEQGGSTVATNASTYVLNGGSMNLSNANFELGQLILGGADSLSDTGVVSQVGGLTGCQLTMLGGSYTLSNGTFSGACSLDGQFTQYGGTNEASISLGGLGEFGSGDGTYTNYGGIVVSPLIQLAPNNNNSFGFFNQVGGTVITAGIKIGPGDGVYRLTNGTLLTGELSVFNSGFGQEGGQVSCTNSIGVFGSLIEDAYGDLNPVFADYGLEGGELSCASLGLSEFGNFEQSGGTNTVAGTLSLDECDYSLSSGVLLTSNTIVVHSYFNYGSDVYQQSTYFYQAGGQHSVANTLSDLDYYLLWGGSLYASNIVLAGTLSVSNPAVILNPGQFQFAGTLQLYGGSIENLGQMLLSSSSVIELMPGSHKLSFLNSAAMNWNQTSSLLVTNWNGSTNGGGSDQLIFGNNSSGLTPAQLRQIVFVNPAELPAGNYAATVLPSGEVVPLPNPVLSWQLMQGQLVMSWAGQVTLQSCTNVLGPYMDLSNASSPYTNISSQGPYRFFRLRR